MTQKMLVRRYHGACDRKNSQALLWRFSFRSNAG
jgi:hypothetical protein